MVEWSVRAINPGVPRFDYISDICLVCSSRPNHTQKGLTDVTEQHPFDTLQGLWNVDYDCVQVWLPKCPEITWLLCHRLPVPDLPNANAKHAVMMGVLQVGKGRQAYSRAKEYVRQWKHMDLGWVDTNKPSTQAIPTLPVL